MRTLACIAVLMLAGCGDEQPGEERSVSISGEHFPHYPGVLLSLDRAEVTTLPKHLDELKTTDADLWLEPRDPEITAITAALITQLGATHTGTDAQVALASEDYVAVTRVPGDCRWLSGLPAEAIATGKVFLARSSSGQFYRVRIDALDRAGNGSMRLSFARIAGP